MAAYGHASSARPPPHALVGVERDPEFMRAVAAAAPGDPIVSLDLGVHGRIVASAHEANWLLRNAAPQLGPARAQPAGGAVAAVPGLVGGGGIPVATVPYALGATAPAAAVVEGAAQDAATEAARTWGNDPFYVNGASFEANHLAQDAFFQTLPGANIAGVLVVPPTLGLDDAAGPMQDDGPQPASPAPDFWSHWVEPVLPLSDDGVADPVPPPPREPTPLPAYLVFWATEPEPECAAFPLEAGAPQAGLAALIAAHADSMAAVAAAAAVGPDVFVSRVLGGGVATMPEPAVVAVRAFVVGTLAHVLVAAGMSDTASARAALVANAWLLWRAAERALAEVPALGPALRAIWPGLQALCCPAPLLHTAAAGWRDGTAAAWLQENTPPWVTGGGIAAYANPQAARYPGAAAPQIAAAHAAAAARPVVTWADVAARLMAPAGAAWVPALAFAAHRAALEPRRVKSAADYRRPGPGAAAGLMWLITRVTGAEFQALRAAVAALEEGSEDGAWATAALMSATTAAGGTRPAHASVGPHYPPWALEPLPLAAHPAAAVAAELCFEYAAAGAPFWPTMASVAELVRVHPPTRGAEGPLAPYARLLASAGTAAARATALAVVAADPVSALAPLAAAMLGARPDAYAALCAAGATPAAAEWLARAWSAVAGDPHLDPPPLQPGPWVEAVERIVARNSPLLVPDVGVIPDPPAFGLIPWPAEIRDPNWKQAASIALIALRAFLQYARTEYDVAGGRRAAFARTFSFQGDPPTPVDGNRARGWVRALMYAPGVVPAIRAALPVLPTEAAAAAAVAPLGPCGILDSADGAVRAYLAQVLAAIPATVALRGPFAALLKFRNVTLGHDADRGIVVPRVADLRVPAALPGVDWEQWIGRFGDVLAPQCIFCKSVERYAVIRTLVPPEALALWARKKVGTWFDQARRTGQIAGVVNAEAEQVQVRFEAVRVACGARLPALAADAGAGPAVVAAAGAAAAAEGGFRYIVELFAGAIQADLRGGDAFVAVNTPWAADRGPARARWAKGVNVIAAEVRNLADAMAALLQERIQAEKDATDAEFMVGIAAIWAVIQPRWAAAADAAAAAAAAAAITVDQLYAQAMGSFDAVLQGEQARFRVLGQNATRTAHLNMIAEALARVKHTSGVVRGLLQIAQTGAAAAHVQGDNDEQFRVLHSLDPVWIDQATAILRHRALLEAQEQLLFLEGYVQRLRAAAAEFSHYLAGEAGAAAVGRVDAVPLDIANDRISMTVAARAPARALVGGDGAVQAAAQRGAVLIADPPPRVLFFDRLAKRNQLRALAAQLTVDYAALAYNAPDWSVGAQTVLFDPVRAQVATTLGACTAEEEAGNIRAAAKQALGAAVLGVAAFAVQAAKLVAQTRAAGEGLYAPFVWDGANPANGDIPRLTAAVAAWVATAAGDAGTRGAVDAAIAVIRGRLEALYAGDFVHHRFFLAHFRDAVEAMRTCVNAFDAGLALDGVREALQAAAHVVRARNAAVVYDYDVAGFGDVGNCAVKTISMFLAAMACLPTDGQSVGALLLGYNAQDLPDPGPVWARGPAPIARYSGFARVWTGLQNAQGMFDYVTAAHRAVAAATSAQPTGWPLHLAAAAAARAAGAPYSLDAVFAAGDVVNDALTQAARIAALRVWLADLGQNTSGDLQLLTAALVLYTGNGDTASAAVAEILQVAGAKWGVAAGVVDLAPHPTPPPKWSPPPAARPLHTLRVLGYPELAGAVAAGKAPVRVAVALMLLTAPDLPERISVVGVRTDDASRILVTGRADLRCTPLPRARWTGVRWQVLPAGVRAVVGLAARQVSVQLGQQNARIWQLVPVAGGRDAVRAAMRIGYLSGPMARPVAYERLLQPYGNTPEVEGWAQLLLRAVDDGQPAPPGAQISAFFRQHLGEQAVVEVDVAVW